MSASLLVKAPRDMVHDYCARPWAAVIAAAERHEDGLSVDRPKWTPMRVDPPNPAHYTSLDGIVDTPRYEKDRDAYANDMNHAFLREGDDVLTRGKTLLYQQNW